MRLVLPRLYVILDAGLLPTGELNCAKMLAECGVRLVQYRNKRAPARELLRISRQLAEFFETKDVSFIVNDRPDVACLAGAAGVHVGQEDLSVEDARGFVGPGKWVGVSTHNREQIRRAAASSADYVAVGPIFSTGTKENPDPVVGTELIREARAMTAKPLVAIGGITLDRTREVLEAGADAVAVLSDIWQAPEPKRRIEEYVKLFASGKAAA